MRFYHLKRSKKFSLGSSARQRFATLLGAVMALSFIVATASQANEEFHDVELMLNKLDNQYIRNGIRVSPEALARMDRGIADGSLSKRDVLEVLGSPNGHEPAQRGDSWFYVINLDGGPNSSVKLACQYRLGFSAQRLVSAQWRRPQCRNMASRMMSAYQVFDAEQVSPVTTSVQFALDSDQLTASAQSSIDNFIREASNRFGDSGYSVTGHADSIGGFDHNLRLSQRRAENVYRSLVDRGVNQSRLSVSAEGETQPVVDCSGRKGQAAIRCHAPNRRVDLRAAP